MNLSEQQADHLARRVLLRKYHLAKNQAHFREQEWDITKDQFFSLWRENDRWLDDGQSLDGFVFSRKNMELGWTIDNVHIITREQMLKTKTPRGKRNK